MTKADIIESVYEKVGFSKKEAAEVVEMVFDTIKETLERGEKIKISGFGNFLVRDKKSRVGRNPQTGEEIEISASDDTISADLHQQLLDAGIDLIDDEDTQGRMEKILAGYDHSESTMYQRKLGG